MLRGKPMMIPYSTTHMYLVLQRFSDASGAVRPRKLHCWCLCACGSRKDGFTQGALNSALLN